MSRLFHINWDHRTQNEETVGSVQFEMWFMTQSEANQKRNGKGREDPNDFPQLVTPAEGRGWGDVLGGFSLSLPDLGLMKKVIPLILFTLLCLVLLRFVGTGAGVQAAGLGDRAQCWPHRVGRAKGDFPAHIPGKVMQNALVMGLSAQLSDRQPTKREIQSLTQHLSEPSLVNLLELT
eukprot:s1551_g1.t1